MSALEETYRKEVDEFNELWEKKFEEFNQESTTQEEELKAEHEKEHEGTEASVEKKLVTSGIKTSKESIQLKALEDALVKQERYKEAAQIVNKVLEKEKEDSEKFEREKSEKISITTENLKAKQQLEINAMKQKVDTQFDIMKRDKEQAFTNLMIKYKNKKFELELQQKKSIFYAGKESAEKASKF